MASQAPILRADGLRLTGNTSSEDGSGGLEKADNVICRVDGVAETRKGQALDTNQFGDSTNHTLYAMTLFKDKIIGLAWTGVSGSSTDGSLPAYRSTTAGAWTSIPVDMTGDYLFDVRKYSFLDDGTTSDFRVRPRMVEANSNLYLSANMGDTSTWMVKLESPTRTWNNAGCPAGTQIDVSIAGQAAGVMTGNSQVAYRYVIGHRDANNNLIFGAPSGRATITSAKTSVAVGTITRPGGGGTTTVRVTSTHAFASGDAVTIDANEANPGETGFSSGTFTITAISGTTWFEYTDVASGVTTSVSAHHYSRSFDITVNVAIPWETDNTPCRGDRFIQVYRSRFTTSDAIVPDDDMALVYETPISTKFADTTQYSLTTNVVTVTTASAHGFATGDRVLWLNAANGSSFQPSGSPVLAVQVASTPSGTTFTYAKTASNVSTTAVKQVVWYAGPTTVDFTLTSNVVTVNTVAAHGYSVGQYIYHDTSVGLIGAGVRQIATVPSSTSFTYALVQANVVTTNSTQTIFQRSIVWNDTIPDSLRQAALYTSPQQEGILQENGRPPAVRDLALYRGALFGAAPAYCRSTILTLMGTTSGSTGNALRADDTVALQGYTFTAKTTENINSKQFKVYTAGSTTQNIADTVASLCRVINYGLAYGTGAGATSARVLSGPDDSPGIIQLTGELVADMPVTLSRPLAWVANRIDTPGSSVTYMDPQLNSVAYSKQGQPEHWPRANQILVGKKYARVLRVVAARDSLFVFKEDGLYRIFGDAPPFSVLPIDTELVLLHPESARAVNDKVFAISTRGVVECSENGVRVISDDLGDIQRLALIDSTHDVHACIVESEHIYMLYCTTYDSKLSTSDTTTGYYVFDYVSRKWAHWPITRTCAIAPYIPSLIKDQLFLGAASGTRQLWDQRRTGTSADYTDETVSVSIASSSSTTSVTLSSATGVSAGDVLFQGSQYAVIESVSSNTLTLHSASYSAWSVASATVYKKIAVNLRWNVASAGAPAVNKVLSEADVIMRDTSFTTGKVKFWSDLDRTETAVSIEGPQAATAISASAETSSPHWLARAPVPQDEAMGNGFKVGIDTLNAFSWSRIQGLVLTFAPNANARTRK